MLSSDMANGEPDKRRAAEFGAASQDDQWARVKRRLRVELGEDVYSSWFGRLELSGIIDGVARLTVPTRFLKSWIEAHYADRLLALLSAEFGTVESAVISMRSATLRDLPAESKPPVGLVRAKLSGSSGERVVADVERVTPRRDEPGELAGNPLDPRLTFETFLVGRSNALAHAAGERVSRHADGPPLYNPLYIHAGVGLGKTHLLQAIGNAARVERRRVIYLTADRFMYGFVSALKAQTALAFKERLRGIDLLIIDDVQFLQGKQIQQEFGHTINALVDSGKQIIVAADRPPAELENLDERVRSRLAGGLVAEMAGLDEDLRSRILSARIAAVKAAHPSFTVSDAVIGYIARAITTNGRDLDGAVNRLLAQATLSHAAITLETAEVAIRDLVRNREPKRVKIEDIQKLVASRYNVSRADLLSERRTASVVKPRQIAMYLAKVLTLRSLPEIGRRFGGRDHTTVLHAVRKIETALKSDQALAEEIELLKRMLLE